VSVPAFGNNSLFGRFREAIVQELAHWPVGPALTDPFWLYLVLWHAGLFTVLLLGQIGYEGRRQGYFD
jgi:photosystem I subunit PsaO